MVNGKRRPNKTQLSLLQGKLQRLPFYAVWHFLNLSLHVKFWVHTHSIFNQLDTRRLLKRLAKENLKPLGRMVAKLAHANPMIVLRTIVQQVCGTEVVWYSLFLGLVIIWFHLKIYYVLHIQSSKHCISLGNLNHYAYFLATNIFFEWVLFSLFKWNI